MISSEQGWETTVRAGERMLEQALKDVERAGLEEDHFGPWIPPLDIRQSVGETVVYADVPGMDEDDIEVVATEGTLSIRGNREFDHDAEDADEFIRIGRSYGPFEASVKLAAEADLARVTAKYQRGVLKIRVPRKTREHRVDVETK